ncbi:MAG TPA: acyl-CoA dehydrogenase family protein [Dehalococcoidia bacterium]|nr:acyl-CoA dehydrogenase family protein [Dehalococcoidia bacterium]
MKLDFINVVRELGPTLEAGAADHDATDTFVAENYAALKARRLFSAAVPEDLGGGDASLPELCAILREMAHYCSSTALAFSMHTHQVAIPAWRWRNQKAPVDGLLRRVAAEELVLVSSGGSDWLDSSGRLQKVDGGYRMNGRKIFSSGSPSGDLLMTSGILEDGQNGPAVLHFPLSLKAEGVRVLDNWRTLGMRATGSNDVLIEDAFIPDAAVGLSRAKGKWHFIFHLTTMIALPLIYSVYVGVAEKARDIALTQAKKKPNDIDTQLNVAEMENELRNAQIALESAIAFADKAQPNEDSTNEILIRRTIAGRSAVRAVEKAMEVAGGGSFFRSLGLERLFRDVQGARFHPLQEKRQLLYTGRYTLGLPVD